METGIAELNLPPLDPIHIQHLDFTFFNLTLDLNDVYMQGFKNFKLEKSQVDKDARWYILGVSCINGNSKLKGSSNR